MSLNDAITMAKEIDQQSKAVGVYQEALDFVARQGFANARFEVGSEEGLDVLEEFYPNDFLFFNKNIRIISIFLTKNYVSSRNNIILWR